MKQVLFGRTTAVFNNSTQFFSILGGKGSATVSTTQNQCIAACAGALSKLCVDLSVAPGAGKSRTWEILKNGVATAVSFTISDTGTSGSDLVNSVTIAEGDLIQIRCTSTGVAANTMAVWSAEFDSTVTGESWYGGPNNENLLSTLVARDTGVFCSQLIITASFIESVAVAGTISTIRLALTAAPGVGKSYTFVVYKNGVAQDGSGGTPNTTTVISDAATAATMTVGVGVTPGDYVGVKITPSGTPASARVALGTKFLPTTLGEFQWTAPDSITNLTGTVYCYPPPWSAGGDSWDGTEANRSTKYAGPTALWLARVAARYVTASGGSGWQFAARVNGASYQAITIDGAGTNGLATDTAKQIVQNDLLDIQSVNLGGSTTRAASFAWAMTTTAPAPEVEFTTADVSIGLTWVEVNW